MDPALEELLRTGNGDDAEEVEAIIRLDRPQVEIPGGRIVSRFGPIVTCRLGMDTILETWQQEDVRSVKAARVLSSEDEPEDMIATLNLPLTPVDGDERRPFGLPLTGAGIVIGLVDWGCDFAAPPFKHPDRSTRLIALWDQRGRPSPDAPNHYGYGTFYGRRQINRALSHADPYSALGYHPADADPGGFGAHGTHVMAIAAGNGLGSGPMGVAPGADLIFVHLADRDTAGLANLGNSVRILEAIDFIARTAGPRPWVVNLSVGRHGGPHDGKTLVEMAFDIALRAAPGRCIVQSTGNYFDKCVHASGRLQAGQARTLSLIVDEADITPNELEVWYSGGDAFAVRTASPTGAPSPWVRLGEQADVVAHGRIVGRIYNRASDPNNSDNHIDIFLYPDAPPGSWTVTLKAETVSDGVFHAWLEKDEACPRCQTRFSAFDSESFYTTGTLANSRMPLVVGAYDAHSPSRDMAPFSSAGPTRDDRPEPDLVAPGVGVLAARSAPRSWHTNAERLVRKSGTSMAAPHVTGTVALCLQGARRPLWSHEIRELILSNTEPVAAHVQHPLRYGRGYLDVAKVVAAVLARPPRVTISSASRSISAKKHASRPKERKMHPNRDFDRLERVIRGATSRAASERDLLVEIMRATGAPYLPSPLDPDQVYREIALHRNGPLLTLIEERFTVLARSGESPVASPQAGDVLLRVGIPGLGHVAVISNATLWLAERLAGAPFRWESRQPGYYATVLEGGAFPHTHSSPFARRVLDSKGRMLAGQLLLRPNSFIDGGSTGKTLTSVVDREVYDELFDLEDEGTIEQETSTAYNVYVYVVGTDKQGKSDFNEMRKLLQKESKYEYPWIAITYDYKKGGSVKERAEKRWTSKKNMSDRAKSDSKIIGTDFQVIFNDMERMGNQGYVIKQLHFLTHFGDDKVYYTPHSPGRDGFSIDDLKKSLSNPSKFSSVFASDAIVKIHGCQVDKSVVEAIKDFCAGKDRTDKFTFVWQRIKKSFPFQLAQLIKIPVWATPMGSYAIYNCTYLSEREKGRRFCIESDKSVAHTFQRTLRFYEANYAQIFSRASDENIFDATYHMKYKPQLRSMASLSPTPCTSSVPPRDIDTLTEFLPQAEILYFEDEQETVIQLGSHPIFRSKVPPVALSRSNSVRRPRLQETSESIDADQRLSADTFLPGDGVNSGEADPVSTIGLGLAVFEAGRGFFSSGDFEVSSTPASMIHPKLAPLTQDVRHVAEFSMKVFHPKYYASSTQYFWFRFEAEYNGFDIKFVQIIPLYDKSSALSISKIKVDFTPSTASALEDPVAAIRYNISGRWDPKGTGDVSIFGSLLLAADGTIKYTVNSEKNWVSTGEWVNNSILRGKRRLLITPFWDIFFSPANSAKLQEKEMKEIRAWYKDLHKNVRDKIEAGETEIVLHGYASTTAGAGFNLRLSRLRIAAVKEILSSVAGSKAKFQEFPHGEFDAATPDKVEDLNERRVRMEVSYSS